MAKAVAIKPEEQTARSYADRLILEKLTEMDAVVKLGELADKLSDSGMGLATVRSLLSSNPQRFAYHERKWIPASRLLTVGRPFAEMAAVVLYQFGGPVHLELLVNELARIREEPAEKVESVLIRLLERNPAFVLTQDAEAALTAWSFVADDESRERALTLNEVSEAEVAEVNAKLGNFDWRAKEAIPDAVAKAAPVRLKALGAACWSAVNSADPRSVLIYNSREFLSEALSTPGFVLGPTGLLVSEADAKKWVGTAVMMAEKLVPTIELDEAAPIEVKPEDVGRLVSKISGNELSTTATKLLEEFYEITPGAKTFPDDLKNIIRSLRDSNKVQWIGGDRFRKAGETPDYINEVPEPFHFHPTEVTDDEGELVDVELTDDGLSSSLRKLLQHPLATDVLDEEILPAPKTMPETVRLVLKSIHRELGTFPLSQLPTGYLDSDPNVQEVIFRDPNGRELTVWVNQSARLMYNLFDWWYEQPVESGAVFTLTKTNRPNVLEFLWLDQPDPVVNITSQRMEELRRIGSEAEGKSTLSLLIEVMSHWPKGADYLTILAEVNVVRRSSRRLIASLLSSYQCFYQRSGSPVWHFDPKKVELGFDKTKRKFVKK